MAFRAALEEWTRERFPSDWARAQFNLGLVLEALGEREGDAEKLEAAIQAYSEALKERARERSPLKWAVTLAEQAIAMIVLADRTKDGAMAETAVEQIQTAVETLRDSGQVEGTALYKQNLLRAQAIRDRLKGK